MSPVPPTPPPTLSPTPPPGASPTPAPTPDLPGPFVRVCLPTGDSDPPYREIRIPLNDANSGSESSNVQATGTVGRYVVRVPRAGHAVAWAGSPPGRAPLLDLGGPALGGLVLHRIRVR